MQAAVLALACLIAPPASAQDTPPPGLYRVDIVDRLQAQRIDVTMETDGATGDGTMHQGGTRTQVRGGGGVLHCVASGSPPALPAGSVCDALPDGGARCAGHTMNHRWRRVSDSVWEAEWQVRQHLVAGSPADGAAAIELAMRGMGPAERAEAREYLQSLPAAQAEHEQTMAQVHASMEDVLREVPPAEAERIRAMMRGTAGSASPPVATHHVVQRMTRVSDRCR